MRECSALPITLLCGWLVGCRHPNLLKRPSSGTFLLQGIGGLRCACRHRTVVLRTRECNQGCRAALSGLLGDEDSGVRHYPKLTVREVLHAIDILHRLGTLARGRPVGLL